MNPITITNKMMPPYSGAAPASPVVGSMGVVPGLGGLPGVVPGPSGVVNGGTVGGMLVTGGINVGVMVGVTPGGSVGVAVGVTPGGSVAVSVGDGGMSVGGTSVGGSGVLVEGTASTHTLVWLML